MLSVHQAAVAVTVTGEVPWTGQIGQAVVMYASQRIRDIGLDANQGIDRAEVCPAMQAGHVPILARQGKARQRQGKRKE